MRWQGTKGVKNGIFVRLLDMPASEFFLLILEFLLIDL